jgi:hypothetical protein
MALKASPIACVRLNRNMEVPSSIAQAVRSARMSSHSVRTSYIGERIDADCLDEPGCAD